MLNTATENKSRKAANKALAALPNYHESLPIGTIDAILTGNGFTATEPAIYCGREGRAAFQVGPRTFLTLTWYKMPETGRYEVVSYLS